MSSLVSTLLRRASHLLKTPVSVWSSERTFIQLRPAIGATDVPSLRPAIGATDVLNLRPRPPLVSQVCGFKVKYKLRKRCKDCYFVVRDQRTYVMCPTHPRHKQMSMVKKPKYTWILTHACQSKYRPW